MASKVFILVLVNIKTKECLGAEFCKDQEDLDWKREMFLSDFGPDYVALTHPSEGERLASALVDLLADNDGD